MRRAASSASSSIPTDGTGTTRSRASMMDTLSNLALSVSGVPGALVHVGHPVAVPVAPFPFLDVLVVPVAQPQQHGGEQGGGQRADQHANLDLIVPLGAGSEGQLADQ